MPEGVVSLNIYEEIRKKYDLLWFQKKRFLYWGAHSQNQLYSIFDTFFIEEKNFASILKNIYFFWRVFSFFNPFSLRFISKQFDFGANKRAFKHCTLPIMVSLASSTPIVPILILKWGQKTTKERQDLHIPKYHHLHRSFLALFFQNFTS